MKYCQKLFSIDERFSDSPFVERIWRAEGDGSGPFLSVAASHWMMVVTKFNGQSMFTIRGPETKVTALEISAGGEWVGICFKLGTLMPDLPASKLVNGDLTLPDATGQSCWLHSSTWQLPSFENADTFVERLVRADLLVGDPLVEAALQGQLPKPSLRTAQRRFLRTTGLTQETIGQIERARNATILLQQGHAIADVVFEAGYYDQSHLNHSLQRFIGQSPSQLLDPDNPTQLSFIYKTTPRP